LGQLIFAFLTANILGIFLFHIFKKNEEIKKKEIKLFFDNIILELKNKIKKQKKFRNRI
jgi:hypothetical protein